MSGIRSQYVTIMTGNCIVLLAYCAIFCMSIVTTETLSEAANLILCNSIFI